ncbi:MAG TPA: FAD-binding oxidoreductase [Verrucomicrobiae bacterium]|nr:FAD-binding oxidoreductase [Verrucomicrobiae bacterium]
MTNKKPDILVIGAGIIGAACAYYLSREGARVTVIDSGGPGGVATPASFAWINASWGNPEPYFRLRREAMAEWRRLAAALPKLQIGFNGGLCWDMAPDEMSVYLREHNAWGYGIRRVDRDAAARLEPRLTDPPDVAVHVAEEGAVEPRAAALTTLSAAERQGARFIAGTAVRGLILRGNRVEGALTDAGEVHADEVLLAAGAASPDIAATAGVTLPLTTPPGLLVTSRPHERLLNGLVMAPDLHMRQTAGGRIVAGADFGGSDPRTDADATAHAVFGKLQSMLSGGERLVMEGYSTGYRPTPVDGFPAIGRPKGPHGIYIAVMHSGITLAPAVGRFAAEELLQGRRDPLLAPYGPSRFTP